MSAPRAFYPATLDLTGASVLVIGAGAVAQQKLKGLPLGLKSVRVVAPKALDGVKAWVAKRPEAELLLRPLEGADLKGCRLVFCCADDADVNAFAARQAKALGAWVCQAQDPSQGDLRVPALVQAAGVQMTLSTGGASPALAKALRAHLGSWLKASDLEWLLKRLEALRPKLKQDAALKERLLKRLTDPKALALVLAAKSKDRRKRLEKMLKP